MLNIRRPACIGSVQDVRAMRSPAIRGIIARMRGKYERGLAESEIKLRKMPKIRLSAVFSGSGIIEFAPMDYALETSISFPLGTDRAVSCVSMGLIDEKTKSHFMAHLAPRTDIRLFHKVLRPHEGREQVIYLCEGPWDYGVLTRVYHALSSLDLPEPTILEPAEGLILHNGGAYGIPQGADGKRNLFDAHLYRLSRKQPSGRIY